MNLNTSLTLNENLTCPGTAINIKADNIVLDCAGKTINYSTAGTRGYGINNTDGYNNVTIKNCNIIEGNATTNNKYAIYFESAENGTITNNTITTTGDYGYGIQLYSSSNSNIANNNITTTGIRGCGIWLYSSSNSNTFLNNNITTTTANIIRDLTNSSYNNYLIYNNSHGQIEWLNTTGLTISESGTLALGINPIITNNNIYLNSSALTSLNDSANLTFYNIQLIGITRPFKDSVVCPEDICDDFHNISTTYHFNVTHFTNYSIGINTKPNITSINITSNDALNRTNGTLTGSFTYQDYNFDPQQENQTKWYINGEHNSQFDNETIIQPENTTHFQNWSFSARIHDGFEWGDWFNTENFTIQNTPPEFNQPLTNKEINTEELFTYNINCSDQNEDTVYYYDNTSLFIINQTTGLINYAPSENHTGTHEINITCSDTHSNTSQTFSYTVNDTITPNIIHTEVTGTLKRLTNATFFINTTDQGAGIKKIQFFWNGEGSSVTQNITLFDNESEVEHYITAEINKTRNELVNWSFKIIDSNENENSTGIFTFYVTNSEPLIELIEPQQNRYERETFNFTYAITDNDTLADIENCSIYKKNQSEGDFTIINTITSANLTTSQETDQHSFEYQIVNEHIEDITWYVECQDKNSSIGTSQERNLSIDTINPIVQFEHPTQGKVHPYHNQTINIDIFAKNDHLNFTNLTITNETHQIVNSSESGPISDIPYQNETYHFDSQINHSEKGWDSGNYTINVYVQDMAGLSTTNNITFTLNHPPTIQPYINPATAYTNNTLTCNGTYSDTENHQETDSSYKWWVEQTLQDINTNTLSSDYFNKSQNVTCEYTPNDSYDNGTPENTSIIISNSAPFNTTSLTFTDFDSGHRFNVSATAHDEDGADDIIAEITISKGECQEPTYTETEKQKTAIFTCNGTALEETQANITFTDGNQKTTNITGIHRYPNKLPAIESIAITSAIDSYTDLICSINITDVDPEDSLSADITWLKNNQVNETTTITLETGVTNHTTLLNTKTKDDELWTCKAIASDQFNQSEQKNTSITIDSCGISLTNPLTLDSDITDCDTSNGINISANNLVLDCNNYQINNTSEYGYGIYNNNANNTLITNCSIDSFKRGIHIEDSENITIKNSKINNTERALFLFDSNNTLLKDSVIENSNTNDIYSNQGTHTILNSTINSSNIDSPSSYILVQWYLDFNITNTSSTPINNTNIIAFNKNSNQAFSIYTDETGFTTTQNLTEYISTNSLNYLTNYTINSSKELFHTDSRALNITDNTLLEIILYILQNVTNVQLTSSDELNRTNGTLTGTWDISHDPEIPGLTNHTKWYKNNTQIPGFNNELIIQPQNITKHENWTFSISVYDGFENSDWFNSSEITIQNTIPWVTDIHLSESNHVDENITCYFTVEDKDQDSLLVNLTWYNNTIAKFNQLISVTNGTESNHTLDAIYTSSGDLWKCNITPYDNEEYGTSKELERSIDNILANTSTPYITADLINNYTTNNLNCYFNITDPDSENLHIEYIWYNNNIENKTGTKQVTNNTLENITLGAGNTTKHQNWTCKITACDPTCNTDNSKISPLITIRNTPPEVTDLEITNNNEYNGTLGNLILNYTFIDDNIEDLTEQDYITNWYKNNQYHPIFKITEQDEELENHSTGDIFNTENAYDENWDTSINLTSSASDIEDKYSIIFENYTSPSNINISTWTLKYGFNVDGHDDTNAKIVGYCYNGNGWEQIFTNNTENTEQNIQTYTEEHSILTTCLQEDKLQTKINISASGSQVDIGEIYFYESKITWKTFIINSTELPYTYTNKGDLWNFSISVSDGEDWSLTYLSPGTTIQNTPPINTTAQKTIDLQEDIILEISLMDYFSDIDNDDLNFTSTTPTNITININNQTNNATLTPQENFTGTNTATFTATDGISQITGPTMNLTVVGVNDAPTLNLSPLNNTELPEDTYNDTINLSDYTTDVDNDPINYSCTSNNINLTATANNLTKLLNLTAYNNFTGIVQVICTAIDPDNNQSTDSFNVNITPINDAPTLNLNSLNNTELPEETYNDTINLNNHIIDVDDEKTDINYSCTSDSTNLTATANNLTKLLNLTAYNNFTGIVQVTCTAVDPDNAQGTDSFNVNITPINDLPTIIQPITFTNFTAGHSFNVTAAAHDIDGLEGFSSSIDSLGTCIANQLTTYSNIYNVTYNCTGTALTPDTINITFTDSAGETISTTGTNTYPNQLPTTPTLTAPEMVITSTETTLEWETSTDEDQDPITYHIYIKNTTEPEYNSSTQELNKTFTGIDVETYFWYIIAGDGYQNQTASQTSNFTIDSSNPTIEFINPTEESNTYFSREWIFINTTVIEPNEVNITFYLYNETELKENQTKYQKQRTHNFTSLEDGIYYYNVTIYDFVDHHASTETRNITLDTTYPEVTTPQVNDSDKILKKTDAITINITVNDIHINTVNLSNQTTLSMSQIEGTDIWEISTTPSNLGCTQTNDICTLTFTAIDLAGNTNSTTTLDLTIDDTNPEIHNLASNDSDNITRNDTTLNFTVTATDTNTLSVSLNNTPMSLSDDEATWFTLNTTSELGCIEETQCTLTATATDIAGNTNSTDYTITIDNTNPEVTTPQVNDSDKILKKTDAITINITVNDTHINTVNLSNQTTLSMSQIEETDIWEISTTPSNLGCDQTDSNCTLTFTAIDLAGNTNSTTTLDLTIDDTNPEVTQELNKAFLETHTQNIIITANASDTHLDTIWINITQPDQTNNITYRNENFSLIYTPLIHGNYYVNSYAKDILGNINQTVESTFRAESTTTATLTLSESSHEVNFVVEGGYSFILNATFNNTGNVTAYNTNLELIFDSTNQDWETNYTDNTAECGNITSNQICTKSFNITLPPYTTGNTYKIFFNSTWSNPNNEIDYVETEMDVKIEALLDIQISDWLITKDMLPGEQETIGNFTISSYGNQDAYLIFNISEETLGDINLTFSNTENQIITLKSGETETIFLTANIPIYTLPKSYNATIDVYYWDSDGSHYEYNQSVNISIIILTDNRWNLSENISQNTEIIEPPAQGQLTKYLGTINITNKGNINQTIRLTKILGTATYLYNGNPPIKEQIDIGENWLVNLSVIIETHTPSEEFKIQVSNLNDSTFQNIGGNFIVMNEPPEITNISYSQIQEVYSPFTINATITDPHGINKSWINLTNTSGETESIDMSKIDDSLYSIGYDPIEAGEYLFTIYSNDSYPIESLTSNTSSLNLNFTAIGTTNITTTASPLSATIETITQTTSKTIPINIIVNNTGQATAYSVHIAWEIPEELNITPLFKEYDSINSNNLKTQAFSLPVPETTWPGTYTLTETTTWKNPDNTEQQETKEIGIIISSNKILDISESGISKIIEHNSQGTLNFTLNSTGNDNLTNIQLICTQEGMCDSFSPTFSNNSIDLPAGGQKTINLTFSVPKHFPNGTYENIINATSESNDSLIATIIIPPTNTWQVSPTSINKTIGAGSLDTLQTVNIENTGNTDLEFSITSTNQQIIYSDTENIEIQPGNNENILLSYNATTIPSGTERLVNITLTLQNPNQNNPPTTDIQINLTTIDYHVNILSPTTENKLYNLTYNDSITINATASMSGINITENITWIPTISDSICLNINQNYSNISDTWIITCNIPNIIDAWTHDLKLKGIYEDMEYTAIQSDSIHYKDISPPTLTNIDSESIDLTTGDGSMTITLNITDNTNISGEGIGVIITYPNGTNSSVLPVIIVEEYSLIQPGPQETEDDQIEQGIYTFTITNLTKGDYDLTYFIPDENGNLLETTDWFEVFTPTTFNGNVLNNNNEPINTNFNLYRPNKYIKLASFTTEEDGTYNITNGSIHNRTYDIEIRSINHTIFLKEVELDGTINDIIDLYEIQNEEITLPGDTKELIGIAVSSQLTNPVDIHLDYNNTLENIDEDKIKIFKCADWNFTGKTCPSSWAMLADSTPYKTQDIVSASSSSFSAYAAGEYAPPQEDTTTDHGSSSGGGGGGGGTPLPPGILEDINKTLGKLEGITLDVNEIRESLYLGENKLVTLYLQNKLDEEKELNISLSSNLKQFINLKNKINIKPNTREKLLINIFAPETTTLRTYSGLITITGEGETEIPVTLEIKKKPIEEQPIQLIDVKITPLRTKFKPGEIIDLQLTIYNLNMGTALNITSTLEIINPNNNVALSRQQEKLTLTNIINSLKHFQIPIEIEPGDYIIKETATYLIGQEEVSLTAFANIKIKKPSILSNKVFGITLWQTLLLILLLPLIILITVTYRKRLIKKMKYRSLLNMKFLPRKTPQSIKIGKIAETNKESYLDIDELKTHTLIAGSTGSGKTVAAQDIAEEVLNKNSSVIVFDPTAQWSGFLRKCEDKTMLNNYFKFKLNTSQATAFKGNIYTITDPKEKINVKEFILPGQITIFCLNKLHSKDIDTVVTSTIQQIFDANLEESKTLKLLLVYDEVHRLLSKFGGSGKGVLQLERACREFRKWGVGLVLISQMLGDFMEEIHANIATEIQMRTKHLADLERIKKKYSKQILKIAHESPTGVGMVQNSQYNKGKPYFIEFRPLLHNPSRLHDSELDKYNKYNQKLDNIKYQIKQLKELKQDIFDLELELKLASDKLQQGNFKITDIYLDSLKPKLNVYWKKLNKTPKEKKKTKITEEYIEKGIKEAKQQRKEHLEKEKELHKLIDNAIEEGFTKEQIEESLKESKHPMAHIKKILEQKEDKLTNYIKHALKQETSTKKIKQELLKSGFSEKIINEKIKEVIKRR